MTPDALLVRDLRFRIGWIVLLIAACLMALTHFTLMFVIPDEFALFAGAAAFNLYAFLVIWIPFRRGERWAWYTTWILPIGLALPAAMSNNPSIQLFYLPVVVVCAAGLLVTLRHFR